MPNTISSRFQRHAALMELDWHGLIEGTDLLLEHEEREILATEVRMPPGASGRALGEQALIALKLVEGIADDQAVRVCGRQSLQLAVGWLKSLAEASTPAGGSTGVAIGLA